MLDIGKLFFDIISTLVKELVKNQVDMSRLDFFTARRIHSKIEDSVAAAIHPLIPFLASEGISNEKQELLLDCLRREVSILLEQPQRFFTASLDGQKLFDSLYSERKLPAEIIESGMEESYLLLGPRVLTVLCQLPVAVKNWQVEAWSENYRRLDELGSVLGQIWKSIDSIEKATIGSDYELLARIRRALGQKIRVEYDLTGLRNERPVFGKIENFFVHPELIEISHRPKKGRIRTVETPSESLDQFVSAHNLTLVEAPPGSGKSTWTRWLQLAALEKWNGIFLRVELRSLSERELPSLLQIVRSEVGIHFAEELTGSTLSQWLNLNQIVLVCDGFDEIRVADRDRLFNWLSDLTLANPKCSVLVTTRPLSTDHIKRFTNNKWKHFELLSFSPSRVREFIQRWYRYNPDLPEDYRLTDIDALTERLNSDPTIRPLTGNPLLLSTLLTVNFLDGSLPSGRSELYRRYVEGMLGVWDDRRKSLSVQVDLTLDEKRSLIRSLALFLFCSEKDEVEETLACTWVTSISKNFRKKHSAELLLDFLRERTGLIVGPGVYSFSHKTIAEYLVATAVQEGIHRSLDGDRIDRMSLFAKRDSDRWTTVIFLWAGLAPVYDVEQFITGCLNGNSLRLAAGVLLDQYHKFPSDLKTHFKSLIFALIEDDDFKDGNTSWSYGVSGPKSYHNANLELPSFRLKGLIPNTNFHALLGKFSDDGLLAIDDYDTAKSEKLKFSIWQHLVQDPRWRDLFLWACSIDLFGSDSRAIWHFWLASNIIRSIAHRKDDLDEGLLEELRNRIPAVVDLLTVAAISNFHDLFHPRSDKYGNNVDMATQTILMVPGLFRKCRSNLDILEHTRKWLGVFDRENPFDLFQTVLEDLAKMKADNLAQVNEALEIVNKLKEARDLAT